MPILPVVVRLRRDFFELRAIPGLFAAAARNAAVSRVWALAFSGFFRVRASKQEAPLLPAFKLSLLVRFSGAFAAPLDLPRLYTAQL